MVRSAIDRSRICSNNPGVSAVAVFGTGKNNTGDSTGVVEGRWYATWRNCTDR